MVKTYFFCGKGGVGKTTNSVVLALYLSSIGEKTLIIDYDGGHSVKSVLNSQQNITPNVIQICESHPSLYLAVVENFKFRSIIESQNQKIPFDNYLNQFPEDLGIIPFADMVHSFFGVPSDIGTLQKFIILVQLLSNAEGFDNIIVDVEPTAGFERLLMTSNTIVRSLNNLQKTGIVPLTIIGAKWHEIGKYLRSSYIKGVKEYTDKIEKAVSFVVNARYVLVCVPEKDPVMQSFDMRVIIENFGGSISACVVNNTRNESHEQENIDLLTKHYLPIIKVSRNPKLHFIDDPGYLSILSEIGNSVYKAI